MKNRKLYLLFLIVLVVLSISIILVKQNNKDDSSKINFILRKALYDFENLKNTKISFVSDSFLDIDETKQDINYLLIYDDYSCPPHNEKAKMMVKQIMDYPVYRFHLLKEDNYQKNNNPYFARSDSVYYYIEKFKNITTPAIIKFDSTFKVLEAFFPTVQKDEEFEEFIEK